MIEHWSTSSVASSPTLTHPATMRASVITGFGEPEALAIAEVPTPQRVNAEVLVKVAAAGINPLDAKTRAGRGVSSV